MLKMRILKVCEKVAEVPLLTVGLCGKKATRVELKLFGSIKWGIIKTGGKSE